MHAVDGKISDKLLDLADRIPYNSVRESTAAVWENFRVNTENCTTPAQLARQLVWFSKQILPRVLHSSWAQQSLSGRQSSTLDLWRDRCGVICSRECPAASSFMSFLLDDVGIYHYLDDLVSLINTIPQVDARTRLMSWRSSRTLSVMQSIGTRYVVVCSPFICIVECDKSSHFVTCMEFQPGLQQVSAAFREEWKASKSRFRSSKHKRVQLSRAEEFALAATTQVPWHASRHMGTRVNFPPVPTCHPPWLGGDGAYPFDAVKG